MTERVTFSPVTRLSGLLSAEATVENGRIIDANTSSTMFRGYEWIMRNRKITDAVYLTQRVCGICSLAHGAVSSYLLDQVFDNDISENAQYLRNIMYAADFLQNHIRHFYLFSLPDFVVMPNKPPFLNQNLTDARLNAQDNQRLVNNYFEAIKASQKSHEILVLFGGKAPHQHSFVHGGVAVAPTADKINRALALLSDITEFVRGCMIPDTELISSVYGDYYKIGITPGRLLSFGLFRFGNKNEEVIWRSGVLNENKLSIPDLSLIHEDITHSWYEVNRDITSQPCLEPAPFKPGAYSWIKSVKYAHNFFEVGPLARMVINGFYRGSTSTMDRIYARTLETSLIVQLMKDWLTQLIPGPPPIEQKSKIVRERVIAVTDAMRGTLLHSAILENEQIKEYNIITPTVWNFSPKDQYGNRGPVESALIGTEIPSNDMLFTILGRIIRSFDPCLACATHVLDANHKKSVVF